MIKKIINFTVRQLYSTNGGFEIQRLLGLTEDELRSEFSELGIDTSGIIGLKKEVESVVANIDAGNGFQISDYELKVGGPETNFSTIREICVNVLFNPLNGISYRRKLIFAGELVLAGLAFSISDVPLITPDDIESGGSTIIDGIDTSDIGITDVASAMTSGVSSLLKVLDLSSEDADFDLSSIESVVDKWSN